MFYSFLILADSAVQLIDSKSQYAKVMAQFIDEVNELNQDVQRSHG